MDITELPCVDLSVHQAWRSVSSTGMFVVELRWRNIVPFPLLVLLELVLVL